MSRTGPAGRGNGGRRKLLAMGPAWIQNQAEANVAKTVTAYLSGRVEAGGINLGATAEGGVPGSAWQPGPLEEFGGCVFGQG